MYSTVLPFNYKNIYRHISFDRKSLSESEIVSKIVSQKRNKNDIETRRHK